MNRAGSQSSSVTTAGKPIANGSILWASCGKTSMCATLVIPSCVKSVTSTGTTKGIIRQAPTRVSFLNELGNHKYYANEVELSPGILVVALIVRFLDGRVLRNARSCMVLLNLLRFYVNVGLFK
jgi:hypothetical protein